MASTDRSKEAAYDHDLYISQNDEAKKLAARVIARFFKHFPELSGPALRAYLDVVKSEDPKLLLEVIKGLPILCEDKHDNIEIVVDILVRILGTAESSEHDAVVWALTSLLEQNVKASLTALFKHVTDSMIEPYADPDDVIREKVLNFVKDKVFPFKAKLLKPQDEMERHITDLIKNTLENVSDMEFQMFMDFLMSLSLFGENAPVERMQELIAIMEHQADLDALFMVSDASHFKRLISCLHMALPIVRRGASCSKFINFINKNVIPVFDELSFERKVDLLNSIAEFSPFMTKEDSGKMLPSIVELLKKHIY